jgi:quercetin dioxygenase-like cupin family protein
MSNIDRRSATTALGLMAVAFATRTAEAQSAGRDVGPGVRIMDLGERDSILPSYKKLKMRDVVVQPGASTPDNMMMNDMLCHMTEGELSVRQNDNRFVVKKGDVWACAKGNTTEGTKNNGTTVAVMRIIDLLPA